MIQSILIPKANYTLAAAKKWLKDRGHEIVFEGKQVHETKDYYRFRQAEPKKKYNYRIIKIPKSKGIKFIVGFEKK